jgi:hypothetical protein
VTRRSLGSCVHTYVRITKLGASENKNWRTVQSLLPASVFQQQDAVVVEFLDPCLKGPVEELVAVHTFVITRKLDLDSSPKAEELEEETQRGPSTVTNVAELTWHSSINAKQ